MCRQFLLPIVHRAISVLVVLLCALQAGEVGAASSNLFVERIDKHYRIQLDGSYVVEAEYIVRGGAIDSIRYLPLQFSRSAETLQSFEAAFVHPSGVRPIESQEIQEGAGGIDGISNRGSDWRTLLVPFPRGSSGRLKVRYRAHRHLPFAPGRVSLLDQFRSQYPHESINIKIEHPVSMRFAFRTRYFSEQTEAQNVEGMVRRAWSLKGFGPTRPEIAALDEFDHAPFWLATNFRNWNEIADVHSRISPDSGVVDLPSLALSIVKSANSGDEKIKKLHHWVAVNIAYDDSGLNGAGLAPQSISDTVRQRRGDCRSKAHLLSALLKLIGIEAETASVNLRHTFTELDVPYVQSFDHMVVFLPGRKLILDATSQDHHWTKPPARLFGKGILHHSSGLVTLLPSVDSAQNTQSSEVLVKVHKDGRVEGELRLKAAGELAARWRATVRDLAGGSSAKLANVFLTHLASPKATIYLPEFPLLEEPLDIRLHYSGIGSQFSGSVFGDQLKSYLRITVADESHSRGIPPLERTSAFICSSDEVFETIKIDFPQLLDILDIPVSTEFRGSEVYFQSSYAKEGNLVTSVKRMRRARPKAWCEPGSWKDHAMMLRAIQQDFWGRVTWRYLDQPGG